VRRGGDGLEEKMDGWGRREKRVPGNELHLNPKNTFRYDEVKKRGKERPTRAKFKRDREGERPLRSILLLTQKGGEQAV
jgi:hypothetical protein